MKKPVLLITFNRPETTKKVFDAIRKYQPDKLYVASDGPRTNEVNMVRAYIMTHIDWKCDIKTLFRDVNLGCKYGVSGAIDWFFKQEKMGIILEDDTIPSQSFFTYCEKMLDKYKYNKRVWQISGTNVLDGEIDIEDDCFLSRYGSIWGWATWRRSWKHYDIYMRKWKDKRNTEWLIKNTGHYGEMMYRTNTFDSVVSNMCDTWDFQWVFAKLLHKGLNIVPKFNMVENIGFDENATHTKGKPDYIKTTKAKEVDIAIPKNIKVYKQYEKLYAERCF